MRFENRFRVDVPIERVWEAVADVERVAPCVPGARLLERIDDDAHAAAVKVKVGPMSMEYRGQVRVIERDAAGHRIAMAATAREIRGQGSTKANIDVSLESDGGATVATVVNEVEVSGRAAAMGQSMLGDVAERLLAQFASNLQAMLQAEAGEGAGGPPGEDGAAPAAGRAEPAARPAAGSADGEIGVLGLVGDLLATRLRPSGGLLGAGALLFIGFVAGRMAR